jgi:hypothetical protein
LSDVGVEVVEFDRHGARDAPRIALARTALRP